MSALDSVAIILSVVSLTVTVIAFFASVKFYKDGALLQQSATETLIKLDERIKTIDQHVGAMFSKTLNAAIDRNSALEELMISIGQQVDVTANRLDRAAQTLAADRHSKAVLVETVSELGEIKERLVRPPIVKRDDQYSRFNDLVGAIARSEGEQLIVRYMNGTGGSPSTISALASIGNLNSEQTTSFLDRLVSVGVGELRIGDRGKEFNLKLPDP